MNREQRCVITTTLTGDMLPLYAYYRRAALVLSLPFTTIFPISVRLCL